MRMNTQHCWVDFNQSFEIAHTVTRQQRCKDQFATNGAVYLEAILRNVVWTDYIATWGGVNSRFVIAYERALQETSQGQAFLLSFDAICLVATGVSAKLQPTRQQYVLGSLLANLTSTSSNLTAVCALDPSLFLATKRDTMFVTTPPSRRQPALVIAALVYLVISLGIGLWYLSLLSPSLANDLWWAGLTPTGGEALLIDLINAQLALTATSALSIYATDANMNKLYNAPTATTSVSPTYSRHIIFTELTTIEYAVPQLRTLSAAWSMRMNTQHCWLDFNQSFEIAHTATRQQRCKDQFATNGAVYLEAILRNVVWTDYMATWGGVNSRFVIAYERALQETSQGQAFLSQVSTARASTSISDELTYWRRYTLDRFELQWQSRWQPGVTESITLENAIGLREIVSIKNFAQGTGPYTSIVLYWIPLNDLRFAAFNNRSLIRGSSRFFGANLSSTLPNVDPEVFGGVTLVSGQFVNQSALFRATIGPFQSVDCFYRGPPQSLRDAYSTTRAQLHKAQLTAQTYPATLVLTPVTWRHHAYYGGNPICTVV
ncbi:hypothetical protein SDRG_15424 [Saprolegnia diclina VS20]|uniref:Uncharacterized protein n=1 Tax=Saprolegnia diclina (strain VS20) TaxID=1156394 RepID=T0PMY3_SAPDV|nr:hypothetical protein SDRG_15424 [Saprolegnia diclina VS20]EQC26774.1 hypothetical protein SDRG_15424 [Saprolegnia diclina VS20]|eukprot:XP_008619817.1 hypothetical protein SDRG_15424 [Saprolegnia diclina VS20]